MKDRIWILNGPNLNLLGRREPHLYGTSSFEDYMPILAKRYPDIDLQYFQSNSEGALIDQLQQVGFLCRGIIFNPGGYTHTSVALADAVRAISTPVYEVHLTDLNQREPYRQISYLRPFCMGHVMGRGLEGYAIALEALIRHNGDTSSDTRSED